MALCQYNFHDKQSPMDLPNGYCKKIETTTKIIETTEEFGYRQVKMSCSHKVVYEFENSESQQDFDSDKSDSLYNYDEDDDSYDALTPLAITNDVYEVSNDKDYEVNEFKSEDYDGDYGSPVCEEFEPMSEESCDAYDHVCDDSEGVMSENGYEGDLEDDEQDGGNCNHYDNCESDSRDCNVSDVNSNGNYDDEYYDGYYYQEIDDYYD